MQTSGVPEGLAADKAAAEKAAADAAAAALAAEAVALGIAGKQEAALGKLPDLYLDPMGLWREAVNGIAANTAVTSVYLAFLDELPPKPPLAEGEEPPPEPEADPDAPPDTFDYKSRHFKYMAADEAHAFMEGKVGVGIADRLRGGPARSKKLALI